MFVYMYTFIYACLFVHMYVYMYLCMYVGMYVTTLSLYPARCS